MSHYVELISAGKLRQLRVEIDHVLDNGFRQRVVIKTNHSPAIRSVDLGGDICEIAQFGECARRGTGSSVNE